ncbi:MAG: glycosyltransferase involved in cell wall biosynthesis [Paraglaciecola sp.]
MNKFDSFLPWTKKRIAAFSPEELQLLFAIDKSVIQDQCIPITNLMTLLYSKLNSTTNLTQFKNRQILVNWYQQIGRFTFDIDGLVKKGQLSDRDIDAAKTDVFGINLVGYARSMTGLGEDIRHLSQLLELMGIPFCVVILGHPADDIQNVNVAKGTHSPLYKCSLFCMNLIEFDKLTTVYDDFKNTFGFTILQAPWELPRLPDIPADSLQLVNEFWAISTFVEQAFIQAGYKNVTQVSPVCCDPKPATDYELNINQQRPFTFLYVFDAGSYLSRKNPQALVESFQRAFYQSQNVRLVLKVSNGERNSQFNEFRQKCAADCRVQLITEPQSSSQITTLYERMDCYISLHRSEGFGRTIAEACLHGKPVIATNWSGSCDILPVDTELLVEFALRELRENEYPFGDNQHWAEPSIASAAEKMEIVFNMTKTQRHEIGRKNRKHVAERYSICTAPARYQPLFDVYRKQRAKGQL